MYKDIVYDLLFLFLFEASKTSLPNIPSLCFYPFVDNIPYPESYHSLYFPFSFLYYVWAYLDPSLSCILHYFDGRDIGIPLRQFQESIT